VPEIPPEGHNLQPTIPAQGQAGGDSTENSEEPIYLALSGTDEAPSDPKTISAG